MSTLHIEHAITDFDVWLQAFSRFAGARQQAGVLAERIRRPLDDPLYVVVDLEFPDAVRAAGFLTFLEAERLVDAGQLAGPGRQPDCAGAGGRT